MVPELRTLRSNWMWYKGLTDDCSSNYSSGPFCPNCSTKNTSLLFLRGINICFEETTGFAKVFLFGKLIVLRLIGGIEV